MVDALLCDAPPPKASCRNGSILSLVVSSGEHRSSQCLPDSEGNVGLSHKVNDGPESLGTWPPSSGLEYCLSDKAFSVASRTHLAAASLSLNKRVLLTGMSSAGRIPVDSRYLISCALADLGEPTK